MSIEPGLEYLTRLQRPNAGVHCRRRRDEEECSEIRDGLPIRPGVDPRQLVQGLNLAGEHAPLSPWCIKQGFDPETVSG
jgi:hypothetical protein